MEYKTLEIKADSVDAEKRIITGYASTWDIDQGKDIIHPGAFKKTLSERFGKLKVLRNHHQLLGRPISAVEDSKGLLTESYIGRTPLGDEALALAKDGILDKFSIGFSIPQGKSEFNEETGVRDIHEVKLYEWSLVDFPMNEAAILTGVKSIRAELMLNKTINQTELKALAEMVSELNALLKSEPSQDTRALMQPQDLDELANLVKNWGK